MIRATLYVAALAFAGFAAVGCGGAPDDDAARLLPASQTADQTRIDLTAPAQRLYFGVTDTVHVGGDVLADVLLDVGASVQLEAATVDSSPLRFEIWLVHSGQVPVPVLELVNAFDVESGFVLTHIDDQVGDVRYILHFPAPASPRDVRLFLTCDRSFGRCTDELQPGETCLAGHVCAQGLACAPTDGECGSIGAYGTCVIPGDESSCASEPEATTCGCDGATYGSPCLAQVSGGGVRSTGACPGVTPPS
jgi:hypothetical protein